ncbi:tetratricopeptide repeat protein [Variovorax sp. J22R133]|uniref:O-linked N-acetylglucosamine transferase, SPINDLY family protein n=1 Tax=Variovorax brevis TaxID=3053503 RepID=UPI0025782479|nr:tetratricopeptide repeat protein [Variovorax sp. J22R133]MDM0115263.1 tetratricopeptide repeat protein [Variovorax sp. J22R133]
MFNSLKNSLQKFFAGADRPSEVAEAVALEDLLRQGNIAVQNEDFPKAIECYKRFAAARPKSLSALIGLGFALLETHQFKEAIDALQRAVALDSKSIDGFYMLGKVYFETGDFEMAELAWHKAHALSPEFEHLYLDYCLLLFNKGKLPQARRLIETGLSHYPQNANFLFYLGNLYAEGGDYARAAEIYPRSIELQPNSPNVLSNYGTALMQTGDLEKAAEFLEKARHLAPDVASIFSNYLFCIQYSNKFSHQERFEAHVEFASLFENPLKAQWGNYERSLLARQRIRIGYVSGDLRAHALSFFIAPIIARHDRTKFEIYCYYSHPVHDATSQRIKEMADQWTPCHGMTDEDLAKQIRLDEIDVLIDLSGHTAHNRLLVFARKPAPVQMTWLGYQATTGLRAIDFRITDEALDPIGATEKFHTEALLRLPACGTFNPAPDSPQVNELPALSGAPFTFGCLNNPSKITDDVIDLWAEILRRNTSSRLMLGNATPDLIEKLSAQFSRRGIEPTRLIFHPKVSLQEYLALHHEIDLALDTFPYNGGTTTFHSLWMGVPIVALDGSSSLSNVGSSVMKGFGLGRFCGDTAAAYVENAIYFSEHLDELSQVRLMLREKMADVTGELTSVVTTSLEKAIEGCWKEYCEKAHVLEITQ